MVIIDSTPDSCTSPNRLEQTITITEPDGGPLTLSESAVNPIPCEGGNGSFVIGVTGGAASVVSGTVDPDTRYQVRVVGPGANYVLNTSHTRSEPEFRIENLTLVGEYTVTVTDANGCEQSINVTIDNAAPDNLGATAVIDAAPGCADASTDSTEGATIRVTRFDRGDGDVAGYPLWQKRIAVDLDQITIALAGTIGDPSASVGVVLDGNAVDATSTISITSIQDLAAVLNSKINQLPGYSATLLGSSIRVRAQIIEAVETLTASLTSVDISVSSISRVSESSWVEVPGLAGLEIVDNLQAGYYRALIQDGSGCGATLVQNLTQGGTIFRIDDPQALQLDNIEFDEITCDDVTTSLTFNLSNGVYELIPNPAVYELTLNSIRLNNAAGGVTGVTQGSSSSSSTTSTNTQQVTGNTYSINTNSNKYIIADLGFDSYELTVRNLQTDCIAVLNFTVEEPAAITYSGETEFIIDPCFDSYQDIFFDNALIEGGEPFTTADGEAYYFLKWIFYPKGGGNTQTINSLSNNVQFNPQEGRYELFVSDKNGCSPQNEDGTPVAFEFNFIKELSNLSVIGTADDANGYSVPVSCEGGGSDGEIRIDVVSAEPDTEIPPYEIHWERLDANAISFQQKLLFQGTRAGDSLEVYSIRLNEVIISYETQITAEPKESVVSEFTQLIDANPLFDAYVDQAQNPFEIIIQTTSNANLSLEIITKNNRLVMVNSSSNVAIWTPLDGTNGTTNFTGFLSLNGLSEGSYRYTISSVNLANCANIDDTDTLQGVIIVENDNVLEIREGPYIDSYLCNGQPGSMFIDVFDGDTGPLTFIYNGSQVAYDQIGNSQYEIYIDAPVDNAALEIYNSNDCNVTRQINIGNGTPLFDITSINFEQTGSFVAREEITFSDLSEDDYDSFEFVFGDGTTSPRYVRDTPEPVTHEYGISGTYFVTLRVFNELGCVEELTKPIVVGKGYSIQVPNVFTPNGDGKNDTFKPKFNGLGAIELSVYDYKGNLIYKESNPDDGTVIDAETYTEPLELIGWEGSATSNSPYYIYTIKGVTLFDQVTIERTGTFIMIR